MKLNLGCGNNHLEGYVNVDKEAGAAPDQQVDLEVFPWPFDDNSVEEIQMSHVLEHLGRDTDVFLGIMKELYRICAPDAQIVITVPHPRHDHYLCDPTHVRPIMPEMLQLFSKEKNIEVQDRGGANTPLGLYLDVDFKLEKLDIQLDDVIQQQLADGHLSQEDLVVLMRNHNNIIQAQTMTLRVVKG